MDSIEREREEREICLITLQSFDGLQGGLKGLLGSDKLVAIVPEFILEILGAINNGGQVMDLEEFLLQDVILCL